jgi:hypothetical protein
MEHRSILMNNRTFKVIIILVGLLFLNIEAAHAGLVHKLKVFITHEFPDYQFLYVTAGLFIFSILSYIIFTPVVIGKEKWMWYHYFSNSARRHDYQSKRALVKKISGILNTELTPHSEH